MPLTALKRSLEIPKLEFGNYLEFVHCVLSKMIQQPKSLYFLRYLVTSRHLIRVKNCYHKMIDHQHRSDQFEKSSQ